MDKAPIVLFVYNRIEHTQKTIEALKNNIYANESDLYVFSDGPKNERAYFEVIEIRKLLQSITGFRNVYIIERERNYGLADNIISGVTEIVNKYKKVIVLEDDIVTSKFFLKFMNDSLDRYENNSEVMSVSGYISPINSNNLPDSFFLPWFECWGWGTWKRSWDRFERNPQKILQTIKFKQINFINVNKASPLMWDQVIDNYTNKIKTWAIFYHIVICENKGKVLYPKESLCQNIGFDGSGENCNTSDAYNVKICNNSQIIFPNSIENDKRAIRLLMSFYKEQVTIFSRVRLYIKRLYYYLFLHLIR